MTDRCTCCGKTLSTGGCITCQASRMICRCGFVLRCGCGAVNTHDCPSTAATTRELTEAIEFRNTVLRVLPVDPDLDARAGHTLAARHKTPLRGRKLIRR